MVTVRLLFVMFAFVCSPCDVLGSNIWEILAETEGLENSAESVVMQNSEENIGDIAGLNVRDSCRDYEKKLVNYRADPKSCKGVFKGPNGTITLLSDHPKLRRTEVIKCLWIICVDAHQPVRLDIRCPNPAFIALHLDVDVAINNRYPTMNRRYCGNDPVKKTFNQNVIAIEYMPIKIHRRGLLFSSRYWTLESHVDCRKTFVEEFGTIYSPNYPASHISTSPCVWQITAPMGRQIQLNISGFVPEASRCEEGYLEIRDGSQYTSPLLAKVCSHLPEDTILTSDAHVLWIGYFSSFPRSPFYLTWNATASGCGGRRTKSIGTITSPDYFGRVKAFSESITCTWVIEVNHGSTVKLDIEFSQSMTGDVLDECGRLTIIDGPTRLGIYPSHTKYTKIHSSSNSVTITAVLNDVYNLWCVDSSMLTRNRGFLIRYVADTSRVLKGDTGVIESFDYPYAYPKNLNTTWIIEAAKGNHVHLDIEDFQLEKGGHGDKDEMKCKGDYVEIIEWNREAIVQEKISLGRFCGNNRPNVETLADTVAIITITDKEHSNHGFRLTWKEKGCVQTIVLDNGVSKSFATARYPLLYDASIDCRWIIKGTRGNKVELYLDSAEIEWQLNCEYDILEVYDGPNKLSPRIFEMCGSLKRRTTLTSSGSELLVRFTTDATISYKGFTGSARQTAGPVCGQNFRSNYGHIYSAHWPNGVDEVAEDMDCKWDIEAEMHYVITLTFVEYSIPDCPKPLFVNVPEQCGCGFFQVYRDSNLVYEICGYQTDTKQKFVWTSTGNHLSIRFRTFSSVRNLVSRTSLAGNPKRRFDIMFKAECVSEVRDKEGFLRTPAIISGTGASVNCSWSIVPPNTGYRILLVITNIEWALEGNVCQEKFVQITLAQNVSTSVVYQDCCGLLPGPIVTNKSELGLKVVGGHQLEAMFVQVQPECDGITLSDVENSGGIFHHKCVRILQHANGSKIFLLLLEYEPDTHRNICSTGYIEIYLLGKLDSINCRSTVPDTLNVTDQIWIVYAENIDSNVNDFNGVSIVNNTSNTGILAQNSAHILQVKPFLLYTIVWIALYICDSIQS